MYHSPADLAALLVQALKSRGRAAPGIEVVRQLCEEMYAASLRTEEGGAVSFHIAFVDPDNPDPDPPHRIRTNRWVSVALGRRLAFSVEQLTKLAKASDPRTSSLATYHDNDGLFVWGLIDQGNRYFEYMNYGAESAQAYRPGLFQMSIDGPAHLSAWIDFEKIGELRGVELAGTDLDALEDGPLRAALEPGLSALVEATLARHDELRAGADVERPDDSIPPMLDSTDAAGKNIEFALEEAAGVASLDDDEHEHDDADDFSPLVERRALDALRRILIRVRNYGHGGALLITADATDHDLNVKYDLVYTRLRDALTTAAAFALAEGEFSDAIHEMLDDEQDEIRMGLYLEEAVARDELADATSALEGVVWFVSLLTRVDGLVLVSPDLQVFGFGVEITVKDDPDSVVLATDARATESAPLDLGHYGTRHRSMIRYCAAHPGSVGIVVSQDGGVRAITSVDGTVVMWDHLKIQKFIDPAAGDDPALESRNIPSSMGGVEPEREGTAPDKNENAAISRTDNSRKDAS